jgi:serine phosphatase RsbU (regulator of sigma subunit)/ligand-binding sensor domain-containing protein
MKVRIRKIDPYLLFAKATLLKTSLFASVFSLVLIGVDTNGQENRIRFEELSIEEGLSQTIVYSIAQDNEGFMWFATEDGLNRYDGYHFTVIRHDPEDTSSLGYNHLLALKVDSRGILWVGTFLKGLDRYDKNNDSFTHYRSDINDPSTISNDMVRCIHEDSNGDIWVGTDDGLNRFDFSEGTFTRYLHDPDDPESLGPGRVMTICHCADGYIWAGTDLGGLCKLDPATGKFSRFVHEPGDPAGLPHNSIASLHPARNGNLWVGTNGGGLALLDKESGRFRHFAADPDDPERLCNPAVFAIYEDREGTVWLGTNGGGLCRYDQDSGKFMTFVNDPNDPTSISYNEIYAIYEDRSGVIWLGTYGGGANKFDLKRKKFVHYRYDPNSSNSLGHPIVWSILEDEPGILMIGSHGGGLDILDRKTQRYRNFRHDPSDPHSLSADIVRVVYKDRDGRIWIGTNGGGLCEFDKATGSFVCFMNDPDDPSSISHDQIRSIYQDSSGDLWIGTNGGGLNMMDRESGSFTRYIHDPGDPGTISNNYIRVIFEDSEGGFWLGTQGGGLNRMDRESGVFSAYRNDPEDSTSINSDFVFSILEDARGFLWLGTWGGGMVSFDRRNGIFTAYTEEDGLPSNSIYGALEDQFGNMWMSSNNGICRFDPREKICKTYNERDGLQSNEFNGNSFFRSPSGEMFFGGTEGFNAFYPAEIKDNPFIPPVVITSFSKLNEDVRFDEAISELDEIRLTHRDYVFGFEFAALEYSAPEKNRYAYKMEGLDDDWVYTDHEKRFASYTTLPPGKYRFRVKASNNDGVWNEAGASVKIVILPPLWMTWWFRVGVILLLAGLILFLYRRRLQTMRMKIELQTAHDAQMSILPQTDPVMDGLAVSGVCIPASEVGGDFYDIFWIDEERSKLGVAVGDVSGKAMQAAMIAVMSSGMIYSNTDETTSPSEVAARLNHSLYHKTNERMYTALCLASIDVPTREVTYTIAGFSAPLIKSNGNVRVLEGAGHGLPLGALVDSRYREDKVRLDTGDVLVLFTDGVTEALNPSREFYDQHRLEGLLESTDTSPLSATEIRDLIVDNVMSFTGNMHQADDMTVLVIKSDGK